MKQTKGIILEKSLIEMGVTKLKRFGFVNVNIENLMYDEVYLYYFEKILLDEENQNPEHEAIINKLLERIHESIQKTNSGFK